MSNEEKPEKRGFKAYDFVLVLLAVLGIMNTLMIDRAKIPDWYFYFSIGLIVVATVVFFASHFGTSWDDKINAWREERWRNKVARKYFPEFGSLANNSHEFNSSIEDILNLLRSRYSKEINGSLGECILQSRDKTKIQGSLYEIEHELKKSNKTFHDLSLLMKQFEFVLYINNRNLNIMKDFVHEIRDVKGKEIGKDIEKYFEEFREKYNLFLSDFKKFCHNVNQEVGEIALPEYSFQLIKKW